VCWIPAFAGMTGVLDSRFRGNDGWIAAFAGMTGPTGNDDGAYARIHRYHSS